MFPLLSKLNCYSVSLVHLRPASVLLWPRWSFCMTTIIYLLYIHIHGYYTGPVYESLRHALRCSGVWAAARGPGAADGEKLSLLLGCSGRALVSCVRNVLAAAGGPLAGGSQAGPWIRGLNPEQLLFPVTSLGSSICPGPYKQSVVTKRIKMSTRWWRWMRGHRIITVTRVYPEGIMNVWSFLVVFQDVLGRFTRCLRRFIVLWDGLLYSHFIWFYKWEGGTLRERSNHFWFGSRGWVVSIHLWEHSSDLLVFQEVLVVFKMFYLSTSLFQVSLRLSEEVQLIFSNSHGPRRLICSFKGFYWSLIVMSGSLRLYEEVLVVSEQEVDVVVRVMWPSDWEADELTDRW